VCCRFVAIAGGRGARGTQARRVERRGKRHDSHQRRWEFVMRVSDRIWAVSAWTKPDSIIYARCSSDRSRLFLSLLRLSLPCFVFKLRLENRQSSQSNANMIDHSRYVRPHCQGHLKQINHSHVININRDKCAHIEPNGGPGASLTLQIDSQQSSLEIRIFGIRILRSNS